MSEILFEDLDLTSTINPDDLRDYANNTKDHEQAIIILTDYLSSTDPELKIRTHGQIGSFCRRIKRLDEAKNHFSSAIDIAKQNDFEKKYIITNTIRLAHAHHWSSEFEIANELFLQAINICKSDDNYKVLLDYAYQHIGKSYFDDNNFSEALKYFNLALELRDIKADNELIKSTQMAIDATNKKLSLIS